MDRKIIAHPITVPQDLADNTRFPLDQISHIPGQASAIRFFDPNSESDFQVLREITSHKNIRIWMDDVGKISKSDYIDWAGKNNHESFLFAVHDTRVPLEEIKEVRGFVYLYSERSEKFRVKRMIKQGFVDPQSASGQFLELSMALRPTTDGKVSGSGLMSSALRQSCLQVRALLNYPKNKDLTIYAYVDTDNIASSRAIEACGFIKKGKMLYDVDSEKEQFLYFLSWPKLHQKIKGGLIQLYQSKPIPIDFTISTQITDSHCGPAIIQSLFKFYQVYFSQDDIVNSVGAKDTVAEHGLRPDQLKKAIEKLAPHLKFYYKENATANDLRVLTHDYKLPVGINWQGLFYSSIKEEKKYKPNGDNGHYSIVVDINPELDRLIIADPYAEYSDTLRTFSFKWFKTRWWDTDKIINPIDQSIDEIFTKKMIFIVVPKDFELPKSLKLQS